MDKKELEDKYRWDKAKTLVRKIKKDAPETDWDDKDWRVVDSIYHKMTKREQEKKK